MHPKMKPVSTMPPAAPRLRISSGIRNPRKGEFLAHRAENDDDDAEQNNGAGRTEHAVGREDRYLGVLSADAEEPHRNRQQWAGEQDDEVA